MRNTFDKGPYCREVFSPERLRSSDEARRFERNVRFRNFLVNVVASLTAIVLLGIAIGCCAVVSKARGSTSTSSTMPSQIDYGAGLTEILYAPQSQIVAPYATYVASAYNMAVDVCDHKGMPDMACYAVMTQWLIRSWHLTVTIVPTSSQKTLSPSQTSRI